MGITNGSAVNGNGEAPKAAGAAIEDNSRSGSSGSLMEFKASTLALRALTMVLLFIALILMVTDKQTQSIPVSLPGLKSPIFLKRTATFSEIKGVQYYVGAVSVVLFYLFFQIVISVFSILTSGSMVGSKLRAWMTFIADQLIAYLLVSAATTIAEIGYIAKKGESKVGWNQVCTDFKHFCTIYSFSLANAFLATLVFVPVVTISAFHLFRKFGATK